MMMSDIVRRPSDQCSPKTSPRGNRSPVVPRQDSTGTLKTTISLGKTPSIVHSGPFYLMKELPAPSELTGATNLIQYHNLEHSFNKFCGRKIKNQLSFFLPNLPGNIDVPASKDDSSLRKLIENPPITSIEIVPLTKQQLDSAFRLHVGPIPEQYRFMSNQTPQRKKHKKKKLKSGDTPLHDSHNEISNDIGSSSRDHEKKHKKQKRHEEEKERRKKKKDKKKKKHRLSPEPHMGMSSDNALTGGASPMTGGGGSLSSLIGGGSNGFSGVGSTSNGLNGSLGRPL